MPTATENVNKRQRFANGFAVDDRDFEDAQEHLLARIFDGMFYAGLTDAPGNPDEPGVEANPEIGRNVNDLSWGGYDQLVFAPYTGAGYVRADSAANTLRFVPGTIMTYNGDEPFSGNDHSPTFHLKSALSLTTAVNPLSSPRIDLVEVKIDFVDDTPVSRDFEDEATRLHSSQTLQSKRRARLTYQIKQGTPAADPVYPTPTTGFGAIAAVYIPGFHNAAHAPENIRDLRWPLGRATPHDVQATEFYLQGANPWIASGVTLNAAAAVASGGTDWVYAMCPVGATNGRLVGVAMHGRSNAALVQLVRVTRSGDGISTSLVITPLADLQNSPYHDGILDDGGDNKPGYHVISGVELMEKLAAGGALPGQPAPDALVGSPMWSHGLAGGPAQPCTGQGQVAYSQLAVRFSGLNGSYVSFVRFFIAHGL